MEVMVLKIAILAEKFAINLSWYIDVIIKLIEFAGDYVDEDLWFRVAQMVTGFGDAEIESDENLQKYAALKMFDVMRTPSLHEALIKIGSYVISEFGYLIANEPGKGYETQFQLIKNKFPECSVQGKALLLTAFVKMTKNSSEVVPLVKQVLIAQSNHWNVEIQARACEYLQMLEVQHAVTADQETRDLISNALEKMPNFSAEIQSNNVLTKRILALKVKDGLHVNLEEAQREMTINMQRMTVNPTASSDE